MKTVALALLSLALMAASIFAHAKATALNFKNGALQAHAEWVQGPSTSDVSLLKITWTTGADQKPTALPGQLAIAILMPEMRDMKSPPITQTADGAYQIFFTMGGAWQVDLNVTYDDGSQETQSLKLDLEGGM